MTCVRACLARCNVWRCVTLILTKTVKSCHVSRLTWITSSTRWTKLFSNCSHKSRCWLVWFGWCSTKALRWLGWRLLQRRLRLSWLRWSLCKPRSTWTRNKLKLVTWTDTSTSKSMVKRWLSPTVCKKSQFVASSSTITRCVRQRRLVKPGQVCCSPWCKEWACSTWRS